MQGRELLFRCWCWEGELTRWPRLTYLYVKEIDAAPRMTYIYASDLQFIFLRLWLTPRTLAFCSPPGSIPWMFGYKYSAKPRLRFPKARAYASKLELEVAVNFAMLVALVSPIDETSKMFLETTTVPISGFLVSFKVMYGIMESAREIWSGCEGKKNSPKAWWCAIVDRRLAIDDRRLRRTSTTWETDLEANKSLERKVLTEARVLTAISRGKQPN